ncbi:MAG: hypothetical protein P4N59_28470 [Negativicutes bacterium]|nr:hypothetical protein [Negativicutes bacterium]
MEIMKVEDRQALVDLVTMNIPVNAAVLLRRARRIALCNSTLAAAEANAVSLFALFVLQEILVQQALNPVTNINNIINLSNAIAALNIDMSVLAITNTNL